MQMQNTQQTNSPSRAPTTRKESSRVSSPTIKNMRSSITTTSPAHGTRSPQPSSSSPSASPSRLMNNILCKEEKVSDTKMQVRLRQEYEKYDRKFVKEPDWKRVQNGSPLRDTREVLKEAKEFRDKYTSSPKRPSCGSSLPSSPSSKSSSPRTAPLGTLSPKRSSSETKPSPSSSNRTFSRMTPNSRSSSPSTKALPGSVSSNRTSTSNNAPSSPSNSPKTSLSISRTSSPKVNTVRASVSSPQRPTQSTPKSSIRSTVSTPKQESPMFTGSCHAPSSTSPNSFAQKLNLFDATPKLSTHPIPSIIAKRLHFNKEEAQKTPDQEDSAPSPSHSTSGDRTTSMRKHIWGRQFFGVQQVQKCHLCQSVETFFRCVECDTPYCVECFKMTHFLTKD